MPTIKKHNNRRTVQQRTTEGTATCRNNGTIGGSKCTNHSRPLWYKWYRAISRPYRLKKTSSMQSKRRDLHLKWLHRATNDNTLYYYKHHDSIVFFLDILIFQILVLRSCCMPSAAWAQNKGHEKFILKTGLIFNLPFWKYGTFRTTGFLANNIKKNIKLT